MQNIKKSAVTKLITNKANITSVEINNKYILKTDNVVCNADPPGVYENLINSKKIFYLNGKKREWIILWDYLYIILVQKKHMKM